MQQQQKPYKIHYWPIVTQHLDEQRPKFQNAQWVVQIYFFTTSSFGLVNCKNLQSPYWNHWNWLIKRWTPWFGIHKKESQNEVPVFVHEGKVITESRNIAKYFHENFNQELEKNDHWYPKNEEERAKVSILIQWCVMWLKRDTST